MAVENSSFEHILAKVAANALTEVKVENREQLRQEFWEELQGDPTALRWQWFGVYEAQLAVVIGMCRTFPRWF